MDQIDNKERSVENEVKFNERVKLIFSDVDETVAAEYRPVTPGLAEGLNKLLREGKSMVFITGQGVKGIQERVTNHLEPSLRKQVLMGSCSGAEVHGFDEGGNLLEPFYSVYETIMNEEQRKNWREIVDQVVEEFQLRKHPVMPDEEFEEGVGDDPLDIMYDDRGPQITFEMYNSYNLSEKQAKNLPVALERNNYGKLDYRDSIIKRAMELLQAKGIPISPRKAGEYAIDFALAGVNKETCVRKIMESDEMLGHIGMNRDINDHPDEIEVWGDKFDADGGTDIHMCEGLPPAVRAINFRHIDPSRLPKNFNVVLWTGNEQEQRGTEEFLQARTS